MASLPPPSYHEATTRPDWLALAAPYVDSADYPSLCLVSRRSWSLFAPRLWADLLTAVRPSGLHPADDLTWWYGFVSHSLAHVAPATRALVRVLDLRHFAKDAFHHFATDRLQCSFSRALHLFPNVVSILLDGHADLDPAAFLPSLPGHRPRLLSIADCPGRLPSSFFRLPCLDGLVYLDASGLPGAISSLLLSLLPHLRVLKVRACDIDDGTLPTLLKMFRQPQLWSLDLSHNAITDAVIGLLVEWSTSPTLLRSDAHVCAEGKIVPLPHGTPDHGQFFSVDESDWSATFSHPERYFADTPVYTPGAAPTELRAFRSDGASPVRRDSADAAVRVLSQRETDPEVQDFCSSRAITHLRLSHTHVSSFGIQKLLRLSSGHLEHFTSDRMPLLPQRRRHFNKFWPPSASLYGILGASHLFRPVFSSNLRVLRIHHSLVTHVPTLEASGLSALERAYLAETSILERVDKAYAQAFVPDMNPRLTRLTLTCIPRRSSGPLIAKLIHFITLLSIQERAIQDAAAGATPGRGPRMLQGLRHLALEFDPDPIDDGFSGDLHAEELMNSDSQAFSFFADERVQERRQATAASRPLITNEASHSSSAEAHGDRDSPEYVTYDGKRRGTQWENFSVPVWAGPQSPRSNEVLAEYRRLVVDHDVRDGVGPASPSQILAGAPDKSYVFHTAWCAALMPPELEAPAAGDLAGMKDVLAELKAHRLAARARYAELQRQARDAGLRVGLGAPHFFWTGTLKVSTPT